MKPVNFPGTNLILGKPRNWNDEINGPCESLAVYTDGSTCLSIWKPSWRDRLLILFGGKISLACFTGSTQPPVWIAATWIKQQR